MPLKDNEPGRLPGLTLSLARGTSSGAAEELPLGWRRA